ncbi:hypothetical protein QJS04_geneDACA011574 [Acorus gramineus]|uniref:Membrane protein of ER body-like protein n=1 Tax=Acorus gramineus TaxID=55184 RepID=A0AAV9AFH1_ACOGR|nr:hypothetical protein QJS04_geneDACA011574 [Acorus gramineus]
MRVWRPVMAEGKLKVERGAFISTQIKMHEDCCHEVINVKTSSQQESNCVSNFEEMIYKLNFAGDTSINEIGGMKLWTIDEIVVETKLLNGKAPLPLKVVDNKNILTENHQNGTHITDVVQTTSDLFPRKTTENGTANLDHESKGHAQVSLIDENQRKEVEFDVVRVLEKQETHDLYCPNCNSCITKRVILRKRKRTVHEVRHEIKREKVQSVPTDLDASIVVAEITDIGRDSEPEVFRCLSCFSFFIPTDYGFRLFQLFGKKEETESSQDLQQVPMKNANWVSSIFESFKGKRKSYEPVPGVPLRGESNVIEGESNLNHGRRISTMSKSDVGLLQTIHTETLETVKVLSRENAGNDKSQYVGKGKVEALHPSPFPEKTSSDQKGQNKPLSRPREPEEFQIKIEKYAEDFERIHAKDERVQIPSKSEALPLQETQMGMGLKDLVQDSSMSNDTTLLVERNAVSSKPSLQKSIPDDEKSFVSSISGQLQGNVHINTGKYIDDMRQKVDCISSESGALTVQETHIDIIQQIDTEPKVIISGVDSIQPLVDMVKPMDLSEGVEEFSQNDEVVPLLASLRASPRAETEVAIVDNRLLDTARIREWDVLKSIVYGGLIESITSIGVVSSAAGGDASTLSIVALGLANLIGGLFIIAHDLKELKNEQHGVIDPEDERSGRYWIKLGQRRHFHLHVIVAITSYILFGLLPPIIYGFSFRKSDNKEHKVITVAAASLLCIALLATGKAHTKDPPKNYVKTIFYYVCLGVAVSGLSYVVGVLIKRLLEHLGLYQHDMTAPMFPSGLFEASSVISGLSSY